jgi:DNA-binding transcriptional ArsR family regulator
MDAFSALADPTRKKIVELLMRREMSAGEIAARFPVSRPAISRHLRVLRQARLASFRGQAQRRVYSLNPKPLAEIDSWLERHRRFWAEKLDALERHLEDSK